MMRLTSNCTQETKQVLKNSKTISNLQSEAHLGRVGRVGLSFLFWKEKYENSQQKRVFNDIFVSLRSSLPRL